MLKYTLLLALAVATLVNTEEMDLIFNADMVDVKPNMTVKLDCGTKMDYRYCVWEHNNKVFQVQDIYDGLYDVMSRPSISVDNQCGIVLDSAHTEDHGIWICTIFVRGRSLVGIKNISITTKPTEPQVYANTIDTTATEEVNAEELYLIFNGDMVVVKPNLTVKLDCGTKMDYRYCVWEHKNEVFQVQDIYYGGYLGMSMPSNTNSKNNQCGIVLDSAHTEDHGTWTCTIFVRGSSLVGSKIISIMMKPTEPLVSVDTIDATATEEVEVQCSVMDARPAADILWFVGDLPITADAESQNTFSESKGTYNTVSTLTYMFKPEEHGQQLICKVDHPTLAVPMNNSLDITVRFAPIEKPMETFYDVKEGSDYDIKLSFISHPAPIKVVWKYGEKDGEMMSIEVPSDNGEVMAALNGEYGKFSVVITMNNVTESNFEKDYLLHVINEFGIMDYQVRLSPNNETAGVPVTDEAMQSNGGVIAGVAIVVYVCACVCHMTL